METAINTHKHTKEEGFVTLKTLIPVVLLFGIFTLILAYKSSTIVFADLESQQYHYPSILGVSDSNVQRLTYGPKIVSIKRQNEVRKILTTKTDIFEILRESGVYIERNDVVLLDTRYVVNGSVISIVRTESILIEEYEDIPFQTEYVKTSKYLKGQEHLVQKGVLGVKVKKYINHYEDGFLVRKEKVGEVVKSDPVVQIVEVGTAWYPLADVEKRGYNCPYWYSIVDAGSYTEEEKRWLKYIMKCESGCNAEHDKGSYRGLFQWSPYWWSRQFSENIFDGNAQIKNTLSKYRAGESTRASQWPACHKRYRSIYPL